MNEEASFKKETSKPGIDASAPDVTPAPPVEPSISSARPETGSQPAVMPPANLAWPPLPDDLRRLYLDQGLSAMKIAKIYDLKYANPKTAESTILHHLKKHGITRRDPAAHIRKVTDAMVDEWVARYEKGESLKQIAGDSVNPVTVFNHLHKRGLQLRDKVEAQIEAVTKFEKRPFSGDRHDMAYIVGLAVGDLAVTKHGRAVRVRLGTTHPAMARLYRSMFGEHGPIYVYPHIAPLVGFEWSLDCDLDGTFDFLLDMRNKASQMVTDDERFLDFLAGFFDAEGTIYYHKKGTGGAFELSIANTNVGLLEEIASGLEALSIHCKVRRLRNDQVKALERGIKNAGEFIWKLDIYRHEHVMRLLEIMPLRHDEKTAKSAIARKLEDWPDGAKRRLVLSEWNALLERIDLDCRDYIQRAKESWERKSDSN